MVEIGRMRRSSCKKRGMDAWGGKGRLLRVAFEEYAAFETEARMFKLQLLLGHSNVKFRL